MNGNGMDDGGVKINYFSTWQQILFFIYFFVWAKGVLTLRLGLPSTTFEREKKPKNTFGLKEK